MDYLVRGAKKRYLLKNVALEAKISSNFDDKAHNNKGQQLSIYKGSRSELKKKRKSGKGAQKTLKTNSYGGSPVTDFCRGCRHISQLAEC